MKEACKHLYGQNFIVNLYSVCSGSSFKDVKLVISYGKYKVILPNQNITIGEGIGSVSK